MRVCEASSPRGLPLRSLGGRRNGKCVGWKVEEGHRLLVIRGGKFPAIEQTTHQIKVCMKPQAAREARRSGDGEFTAGEECRN